MIFYDNSHKNFYETYLMKCRRQDVYHASLIYCLGINADTRRNINRIYDFKTGEVKTRCLYEGWQTSGSLKVVRLAFNLYNGGTPSIYDYEHLEEQLDECDEYAAANLFCCLYAPYFWEAIKIRYPDYVEYEPSIRKER